jgi:Na+/proline symporter
MRRLAHGSRRRYHGCGDGQRFTDSGAVSNVHRGLFAFYGGKKRFGEAVQVHTGRLFIVLITIVAYAVALRAPETIFELAIQYAFSGFAALSPLLIAALFWKGSTKWGALASTVWTVAAVVAVALFQHAVPAPAPGPATVVWSLSGAEALSRTPGGTAVFGFMPVVPMVIISVLRWWLCH